MSRAVPKAIRVIGAVVVTLSVLLAARLAWEQTVWSWENGPQMVGFSLMHSGLGLLLLLALWGGLIWVVVFLIAAIRAKSLGGWPNVSLLIAYGLAWVVVAIPYGFWQRMFIDRFTQAQANEFFLYDAAMGDVKSVEAFLQRGVDINAQGDNGTALHGAAVEGELKVLEFLLSHGADVNAINAYGDSPLANALNARRNGPQVAALLRKHGGKLVRGTDEQRDRVIREQVRRNIEEMNKRNANE